MSVPGWYPDPGGASGQFRYWDGSAWSAETSASPDGHSDSGKRKPPIGIIIAVVAAVAAIALIAVFLIPALTNRPAPEGPVDTSSPTESAWDETSKPTTPPPSGPSNTPSNPQPSGGAGVNCPAGNPNRRTSSEQNDRLTGGGLVVNQIPGWTVDRAPMGISFAYDVQSQSKTVRTVGLRVWASNIAVGALKKSDGFTDVKQAADKVMQCLASSGFYEGFQRREDLVSEAQTVSGRSAYHLKTNIFVTGWGTIKGDVVDVIVVDTGDADYFGVYFGIATIEHQWVPLVDAATASLGVA